MPNPLTSVTLLKLEDVRVLIELILHRQFPDDPPQSLDLQYPAIYTQLSYWMSLLLHIECGILTPEDLAAMDSQEHSILDEALYELTEEVVREIGDTLEHLKVYYDRLSVVVLDRDGSVAVVAHLT